MLPLYYTSNINMEKGSAQFWDTKKGVVQKTWIEYWKVFLF